MYIYIYIYISLAVVTERACVVVVSCFEAMSSEASVGFFCVAGFHCRLVNEIGG